MDESPDRVMGAAQEAFEMSVSVKVQVQVQLDVLFMFMSFPASTRH